MITGFGGAQESAKSAPGKNDDHGLKLLLLLQRFVYGYGPVGIGHLILHIKFLQELETAIAPWKSTFQFDVIILF